MVMGGVAARARISSAPGRNRYGMWCVRGTVTNEESRGSRRMCAAWQEEMDVQGLGACSEDAAQVAVIGSEFRRKPVSAKKRHGPKKAPGVPLWALQAT